MAKFFSGPSDSLAGEIMATIIDQRAAAEKRISEDEDPSAPCTFLMRLLRNQSKNPASLTDREINTHAFGNILAGACLYFNFLYICGLRGADYRRRRHYLHSSQGHLVLSDPQPESDESVSCRTSGSRPR